METTIDNSSGIPLIKISGDFTVYEVKAVHQTLLEYIEHELEFSVDLQGVTECDTSAVQLLLSLQKTGHELSKKISILNPSSAVISAMERIGLCADDISFD